MCEAEIFNACGGCATLAHVVDSPCGTCGNGTWKCNGTEAVSCLGATDNGCGGCSTLSPALGSACGSCSNGIIGCAGTDGVTCTNATTNPCGGCDHLGTVYGSTCGACGTWGCSATAMTCSNPGITWRETATWATLAAKHANCAGLGDTMTLACAAAVNRRCATHPTCPTTSGFGFIGENASVAAYQCTNGTSYFLPGTTFTAAVTSCTNFVSRTPQCAVAAHRLCVARGFVSGFGPYESDGASMAITCISAGVVVAGVPMAELTAHHANCVAGNGYSPACLYAIRMECEQRGHETGFGPVEVGAAWSTVDIACLD